MSDLWTVIKNSIEKISEIIRAAFPITGGFLFEHDFRHQINIFYGDLLTAFGCICDIQDLPPQNTLRGLIFSEHDDAVRETNRFIYSMQTFYIFGDNYDSKVQAFVSATIRSLSADQQQIALRGPL